MILVSHDRYLIDKLTEQLFIFTQNGHLQIYNGNYTDFRLEEVANKQTVKNTKQEKEPAKEIIKSTNNFKQEKELHEVEKTIATLEKSIADLNLNLNDSSISTEELIEISTAIQSQQKELDAYLEKWMQLSEL
ncbi:MAG: hypothetical protein EOP45_20075 [Sphingobacteriaceae bacterium]|nr:MAG: hypothetical protein EOP45_20075 [Sphingobacteriaceae bacterium]